MSQPATSSRLTNSAVNINGAANISTNYGVTMIGVTGNNFDISALSTGNRITIGATGTKDVTIGSAASGTVTFPGVTTFTTPINGGVFTGTAINGTAASTPLTIGSNLTSGSVSIATTANATTVTIGNNSTTGIGTVNVGTGSATVNVGNNATTSPTAIVLGRTGGSVTLGPPLTLGAAPTTSAHLGGFFGSTGIATSSGTTSANIQSMLLPAGSWVIIGNAYFGAPTSYAVLSISNTSGSIDYNSSQLVSTANSPVCLNLSRITLASSNQTWYLVAGSGSSVALQYIQLYAYRIG